MTLTMPAIRRGAVLGVLTATIAVALLATGTP